MIIRLTISVAAFLIRFILKSDAYAGQLSTETVKAAYDAGVQDYHA